MHGEPPRTLSAQPAPLTWHAQTGEAANLIQAGGIILAGVGMTLVDVHLTARPCVAFQTLTVEGAICIHTLPCVLARVTVGCNT